MISDAGYYLDIVRLTAEFTENAEEVGLRFRF
ncbi:hypothetical protein ES705_18955 [subsurface metagenome]